MIRLARLSIRRPRAALTFWAIFAVVLSLIGLGVSDSLSPSISVVPGSESSRAQTLSESEFGPSVLVPILLEGPKRQLDRQGPKLVVALGKRDDTRVMSAWSTGESGRALRPRPDAAMIVVVGRQDRGADGRDGAAADRAHRRPACSPAGPGPHHRPADARPGAQGRGDRDHAPGGADRRRRPLRAAADRAAHARGRVRARRLRRRHDAHRLRRDGAARPGDRDRPARGRARVDHRPRARRRLLADDRRPLPGGGDGRRRGGHDGRASRAALRHRADRRADPRHGDRADPDPHLDRHRRAALLGARHRRRRRGDAGRADAARHAASTRSRSPRRASSRAAGTGSSAAAAGSPAGPSPAGAVATAALVALALPVGGLKTGPPDVSMLPASTQARQDFERVSAVMGPGWPTPFSIVVVSTTAADHGAGAAQADPGLPAQAWRATSASTRSSARARSWRRART